MNIVITGGGTGGHLYPGLELAKHYKNKGHKIFYIASENGIDKDIISNEDNLEGIEILYWNLKGFNRSISINSFLSNSKNVLKLCNLNIKAKKLLKEKNINLVIGVGGYISFPILNAAIKYKIPTIMHEQNSYPGAVNRRLSPKVNKVLTAYGCSKKYLPLEAIVASNPRVDQTFRYLEKDFKKDLKLNEEKKIALFLGGSLGAEIINKLFLEFINSEKNNEYQAILISGLKNNKLDDSIDLKDNLVLENTNELLKYMTSADIIISRAGATSLLEIIYLEKKSIIIPSYNVVALHQHANANEFEKDGLITVLDEKDIKPGSFLEKFEKLENNDIILKSLKSYEKISSLAKFDEAVEEINGNR